MTNNLINEIITTISRINTNDNILVADNMIETDKVIYIDNNSYNVSLNGISIHPLEAAYETRLKFSICANPLYSKGIDDIANKITEILSGYDLEEIYKVQEIEYGDRFNATGAITYVYEVKTIRF